MDRTQEQMGIELLRLTRRCRGFDKHISAVVGLSIDEIHCLSALFSEKPPSVKTLGELINVAPTRVSKILRNLEQQKYVSREIDVADRRKEHVTLTENGARVVEGLISLYNEIGSRFLEDGTADVSAGFHNLLHTPSHSD